MKPLLILSILVTIMSLPLSSHADIKTVNIDWQMGDTNNIQGYKVYLSYNSTMSNQQLAGQTNDPTATSLVCSSVDITGYPVYFTVAAVTTEGSELASEIRKFDMATPDSPKNLRISSP